MTQTPHDYHRELREALDDKFLRAALDNFAVAYRANRPVVFEGLDTRAIIARVAQIKDNAVSRLPELYEKFKMEAERRGVHVHYAGTAEQANRIILDIARENECKVITKSKSMTAEETGLNRELEKAGLEVVETDLGEWIIQLRHEGPSHMVLPAIHLSRHQVADLFSDVTGEKQSSDVQKLVKVARRTLRPQFARADMGITGANFAVAETGALGMVTNEGNLRLTTTLPKVHVALCGIEKLIPTLDDALEALKVLPRNATGQALTAYVTWICGANECAIPKTIPDSQTSLPDDSKTSLPDDAKIMHVVFVDNGRSQLAQDPLFSQVLRCVRCGACANVCPVYRMVGGHKLGHVYIGAIGLILTYFFHGHDKAANLVQNCVGCEACKDVCAAGIDLPRLIRELRARLNNENGAPLDAKLLGAAMKNRRIFHTLLKFARFAQRPLTGGTPYLRHLPQIFLRGQDFRALPAVADRPFRDKWAEIYPRMEQERQRQSNQHTQQKPNAQQKRVEPKETFKQHETFDPNKPCAQQVRPKRTIALFAGCAQDFVYPEQLEAGLKVLSANGRTNVCVEFPMEQTCCGLPLEMMGQRAIMLDVARQNITAFETTACEAVVTLCASCAGHLKNGYPELLHGTPDEERAKAFASKVIDFSSYVRDELGLGTEHLNNHSQKTAYHASCHLCRNLGVSAAPRELIAASATYLPSQEEDVCCGFGGSYSVKFPEVSAALLKKKLNTLRAVGADLVVADCPGCIMQIRGGFAKEGSAPTVSHIAELLAATLKSR